jgi:hypothetical protein
MARLTRCDDTTFPSFIAALPTNALSGAARREADSLLILVSDGLEGLKDDVGDGVGLRDHDDV